jgi:hypothetical protein
MKRFAVVFSLIIYPVSSIVFAQGLPEEVRQVLRESMPAVTEALRAAGLDTERPITLLPPGEMLTDAPDLVPWERYLEGQLKIALTNAGFPAVEALERNVWDNAVAMIEVHEVKGSERVGVLDPNFLNEFGKLQLAQRLMTYELVDASFDRRRVMVEFTLHLYDLETNRHVWGDNFVRRIYLPDNVQGLVEITPEARQVLRTVLESASESMSRVPRLSDLGSLAIVPLSGDVDRYITQLTRDAVSRAGIIPRELALRTEAEARTAMLTSPETADAVMVGAVRDLFREELPGTINQERFKISAEVQLAVLAAGTLDVLWSDTLFHEEIFTRDGPDVEQQLLAYLISNPMIIVYIVGGLVMLIVLFKLIKAGQRVR